MQQVTAAVILAKQAWRTCCVGDGDGTAVGGTDGGRVGVAVGGSVGGTGLLEGWKVGEGEGCTRVHTHMHKRAQVLSSNDRRAGGQMDGRAYTWYMHACMHACAR